ncbi:cation diffusion facilitator family transporter [Halonatronum saccharophilum]|uniref:cation diffusion facilitator family transporter n=1 Tax=Halonatronum saccharophilum TaxID=150060 RepID=UPI0004B7441B|nr:cation diffusion facilitator family transporter [Halonatronum saccharophilum]
MDNNRYDMAKKVGFISLTMNIFLSGIKIIVGYISGSRALVADGFHSVSDVLSTVIVIVSVKISRQPPDKEHPYGHGKAESIATKLLGIILILTGLGIGRSAVTNILQGNISIPTNAALVVVILSIGVKEVLYHYIIRVGRRTDNKTLIADAYHHRSDALSSIAALIGIGGAIIGYPIADSIASLVVALFIIKVGVNILLEAINELMDAVPNQEKREAIIEDIERLDNVIEVGNIKLRAYGPHLYIDIAVVVEDDLTVIEGHTVAVIVKERIKELNSNVEEVLVHIDPEVVYRNN